MPKLGMEPIRTEQVVDATKRCIVKKGVSNLSVKDIASEARVSTGIIYHYFENKEDILLKVIREAFRRSHEQVLEKVEPIESPRDKLRAYIEQLSEVPKDNPEFFIILLNYLGQATSNQEINRIVTHFFGNVISYVEELLSTGAAAGVFKADRVKSLAPIIVAIGLGMGAMWTISPRTVDIEEMGMTFKDIVRAYIT